MKAKRLLALGLSLALAATTVLASPGATGVVRAAGETEYDYQIAEDVVLKYIASDNLIYALKADNTAALAGYQYELRNTGALRYGYFRGGTEVNIPSSITYNGESYTVDQIGGTWSKTNSTSNGSSGGVRSLPGFLACKNIEKVVIPNTVTKIGLTAFNNCDALKEVIIPESVTSIDDHAFSGCDSLENITLPGSLSEIGNYVFSNCYSLKSINIPNKVTRIGNYAFSECSSLSEVELPDSLTKIGDGVFDYCNSLKTLEIPANVSEFGYSLAEGAENLEKIVMDGDGHGDYSIDKNGALVKKNSYNEIEGEEYSYDLITYPAASPNTSFDVYKGFENLDGYKFNYAKNLTAFTVTDNSVYNVDDSGVLYRGNCMICYPFGKKDTTFTLKEGTTDIEYSAFSYAGIEYNENGDVIYNGIPLEEITLPASFRDEYIANVLGNLYKLKKIHVADGNTALWASEDGILFSADKTKLIYAPMTISGSYTVPDTVKTIGANAFYRSNLESLSIPGSVTELGSYFVANSDIRQVNIADGITEISYSAFENAGIESLNIPSTVTKIGRGAFNSCKIKQISIPDSVTEIEAGAFNDCDALTEVVIPGSVKVIGREAFFGCDNLKKVTILGSETSEERSIGDEAFYSCDKLTIYSIPANVSIGENAIGVIDIINSEREYILESNVTITKKLDTPKISYASFTDKNGTVWTPTIYGVAGSPAEAYATATNGGVKFSTEAAPTVIPEDPEKSSSGETTPNSGTDNNNTNTDTTSGGAINPSGSGGGGGGGGGASAGTTTTQKNADGSTTTTNVVKTAAGTTTTESTTYTDGSKKVVKTVESTDGSKKVTQTNTKKDGSKTVAEISVSAAGKGTVTTTVTDASGKETGKASYSVSGKKLTLKSMEGGKSIVVPATVTIGGTKYKVTKIAAGAMKGNKTMTKVQIGKNVTSIGKNAFSGDKKLKTIVIKGKVTSVGKNAFKGIAKKAVIKVSATKKNFTKIKKAIKNSGIAKTVTIKRTK